VSTHDDKQSLVSRETIAPSPSDNLGYLPPPSRLQRVAAVLAKGSVELSRHARVCWRDGLRRRAVIAWAMAGVAAGSERWAHRRRVAQYMREMRP